MLVGLFLPIFKLEAAPVSGKLVGQVESFNIDPHFDRAGRGQIQARLVRIGKQGLFYIDDSYLKTLEIESERQVLGEKITELSDLLDTLIVPKLHEWYGTEPAQGLDGEALTSILLATSRGLEGGYVEGNDLKSRDLVPTSNERKLIVVDVLSLKSGRGPRILAHEFTHLISLEQKQRVRGVHEERWLEEMRAMVTPTALGLDPAGEILTINRFARLGVGESVTTWSNRAADEASVGLLGEYLRERFGIELFVKTMRRPEVGMAALDKVLQEVGSSETFAQVFQDWAIANFVAPDTSDRRFTYIQAPFSLFAEIPRQTVEVTADTPVEISGQLRDWSSVGYGFKVKGGIWGAKSNTLRIHWTVPVGERITWLAVTRGPGGASILKPAAATEPEGTIYVTAPPGKVPEVIVIPVSQFVSRGEESVSRLLPFRLTASLVGEAKPYVLDVNPGVITGQAGEVVTIQGMDFSPSTRVTLNGTEASGVLVIDPDHLSFRTPALSVGPVRLQVINSEQRGFTGTGLLRVGIKRPDGTLIRGSNIAVYLLEQGERRPILNERVFLAQGFKWNRVVSILDQELAGYPAGQILSYPDGMLISFNKKIALVSRGERREFIYLQTIDQVFGYDPATAILVSEAEWNSLSVGASLTGRDEHPDGALVRVGLSDERYVIQNGARRYIPSKQVFDSWGFQEKFVATISPEEFDKYPWGEELKVR